MHLGRAVVDAEGAHVVEDPGDLRAARDAGAAEDLERTVDGAVDGLGAGHLGEAALAPRGLALVENPGGVPDGEARPLHVHQVVRELEAHALVVHQHLSKALPLVRIRHRRVVGSLGGAELWYFDWLVSWLVG